MAPLEYRRDVEWEDYDEEDQDEDKSVALIPYDLDTTSLATHVACLHFGSKYEHRGHPYDVFRLRALEMGLTRTSRQRGWVGRVHCVGSNCRATEREGSC